MLECQNSFGTEGAQDVKMPTESPDANFKTPHNYFDKGSTVKIHPGSLLSKHLRKHHYPYVTKQT
jgi:hypothetical protein